MQHTRLLCPSLSFTISRNLLKLSGKESSHQHPLSAQLQNSASGFPHPALPSMSRRWEEIPLEKPTVLVSSPTALSREVGKSASVPVQTQFSVMFPCHPLNYKWTPNYHKWKQIQRIKSLVCRDLQVSEALHWPHFVLWCTLCRDATETASALFFWCFWKKKGRVSVNITSPVMTQLKMSRNNKCSENQIKTNLKSTEINKQRANKT